MSTTPARLYTTGHEVRCAFDIIWTGRLRYRPQDANDKPARREAFVNFVDHLAREGHISELLASKVTL